MSEKSTRKAPDYTDESRVAPNRSVFRPQLQHWSCNTHQEWYDSSESGLKKEIPGRIWAFKIERKFWPRCEITSAPAEFRTPCFRQYRENGGF